MVSIRRFSRSCWGGEMMDRIHRDMYVVFDTDEVAKVTYKYRTTDGIWHLEFDRRVGQYKDRSYPKDYGSFTHSGDRHGLCWYECNNIRAFMDESEYQAYMAAVKEEEEEKLKYKRRLEDLKRKEEEERKAKEEARKRAIIEKEVRAQLEAEYEAKLESELEKRMRKILSDVPVSDQTTVKREQNEAESQFIDTPKMMRNGLDEVLVMLKIRKQGGIAKLVEVAKTKADFEKCIALLKARKQTGLAKQIEELLKDC